MIIDITPEQQKAVKMWAELREKYPKKTRDEILDLEDKKSKAEIFEIEEKAFTTHGREGGLSGGDLSHLLERTRLDKEKHL